MDKLEKVFAYHISRYPEMEISDFVKLIYQTSFGGMHLLEDKNWAKTWLEYEFLEVSSDNNMPLYESIGNDLVRVNLSRYKALGCSVTNLWQVFEKSANEFDKNIEVFENNAKIGRNVLLNSYLHFSIEEYDAYLEEYRRNNYPLVSHSEKYHQLYNPHYRIVLKKYL